jgi:poly(hydroxyalkanoate) depolymerase family esterase
MKFNSKLMERMRAATSTLSGKGPQAATAAIQDALKVLSPRQPGSAAQAAQPAPAMRDINPPPPGAAAYQQPHAEADRQQTQAQPEAAAHSPRSAMQDVQEQLKSLMPDMLANMERHGVGNLQGFKMPGGMPSAGKAPPLPGKFVDGSFTNAAGTRSYKLYIPSTHTGAAAPLVVMLHGCTQDPDDFANGTQMNLLAEEMGCLVVYPAQSQQANASRCWNWFSAVDQQRGQGEPSIIAGITETIMHDHAIKRDEVYVAGLSAGGAMATIMGTLYPDLYAAVGVHSGLPFAAAHDLPSALAAMKGNFGPAKPSGKQVPIIVFHGDKDTTVHPACGDAVIKQGAHTASRDIVVEPGRVPDGHAYTRTVHQRADGTPQAEQWLIHGAGHAWSGGSVHGSYTDGKGPDASREMMRFFQTKR